MTDHRPCVRCGQEERLAYLTREVRYLNEALGQAELALNKFEQAVANTPEFKHTCWERSNCLGNSTERS